MYTLYQNYIKIKITALQNKNLILNFLDEKNLTYELPLLLLKLCKLYMIFHVYIYLFSHFGFLHDIYRFCMAHMNLYFADLYMLFFLSD
jgi:hypothetical protein